MRTVIDPVVALGPWGTTVEELRSWLATGAQGGPATVPLPNLPGFVASPFINLVQHAQRRCLAQAARQYAPDSTGVVLASVLGDTTTADRASQAVADYRTPQPLLFYQSIPLAVLGHVSVEFSLTGPLVCLAGGADLFADTMETAEMLLEDGAGAVLVTYVDAGGGRWSRSAATALAEQHGEEIVADWDCCVAALLRPAAGDEPALRPADRNGAVIASNVPLGPAGFLDMAVRAGRGRAGGFQERERTGRVESHERR